MGLSGRFLMRNALAVGVALGVTLLLLIGFYSLSPWLLRNSGSVLAMQRVWSEIRFLAEHEGSEELLRLQTQEAISAMSRETDSEWLLVKQAEGKEAQILYKSFALDNSDLAVVRQAAANNSSYRFGWREFRVRQQKLVFADGSAGELFFLSPPGEMLNMERSLFVFGAFSFTLVFMVASAWLGRWLQRSIIDPLTGLRQAAQEITLGEQLPEIPNDGVGEVAELAVALDLLRLRLKESMRLQAKADEERAFLISSISHDLKTPLTALTGYLEIVQLPELSEERRNYYLHNAELKANQLRLLIDDLLLFSKLEAGQDLLLLQTTMAGEFLTQVIQEHLPLYEQKGAVLELKDQLQEPLCVALDRERFPRVLQNVLDNARRYIPEVSGAVTVTMRANRSDFILEIRDNGPGLAPGEQERIFERFYRGDTSRAGQGSGLGLAIARQIVKLHGGNIWAREPEGDIKGCVIIISLPKLL